jgi:anti-sigma regulatory factor (Ser/Thr protein kinase)
LPDLSTGLEERESHGLGMFFIREWMDKVEYENKAGVGNILTLLKRRGGSRKVSSMTAYRP